MTLYTATINRPGYLPDSDTPPPLFRTPNEAWQYLYEEHSHAWDQIYWAHSERERDQLGIEDLHLETDTQFDTQIFWDVGELHGADGYVYSVAEAVDLPANRVELFDHGSMSGSILFFTDEEAHTVRDTIADNVGVWWNLDHDYPDTDSDGVILLSDSWQAHFNDDIILDSGIRSF